MSPTIFLPASFASTKTKRFFFAIAYNMHISGTHPLRYQIFLGGMSPSFSQSYIVIIGAPLITMALDFHMHARIAFEELCIFLKDRPGIIVQIILIKFEVNILQV
jgi:hypothetical protein